MNTGQAGPDQALARRIESQGDFVAALHDTVALAGQSAVRRMVWVDPDFADWPLDEAALWPRLVDWLRRPRRQLVLLACSFDGLARQCPRFVAGYRLWAHAIHAFSPAEDDVAGLPSLALADDFAVLQLFDRQRWRGRISGEASELRVCAERVDALLQRASPAFAATTLGL
jgi:hypothetical protein